MLKSLKNIGFNLQIQFDESYKNLTNFSGHFRTEAMLLDRVHFFPRFGIDLDRIHVDFGSIRDQNVSHELG